MRKSIGRALKNAYLSKLGLDELLGSKDKYAHIVISIPKPPNRLIECLRDLTDGLLGTVINPAMGGIISLRELSSDSENKYDRVILESYILQIASGLEIYLKTLFSTNIRKNLKMIYPAYAPKLIEFRATRNCIIHNMGIIDENYLEVAEEEARSNNIGELINLDWDYAYNSTLLILDYGNEQNE